MGRVNCGAHIGSIKRNIFRFQFIRLVVFTYERLCMSCFPLMFTINQSINQSGLGLQKFALVSALEATQIILKELCPGKPLLLS